MNTMFKMFFHCLVICVACMVSQIVRIESMRIKINASLLGVIDGSSIFAFFAGIVHPVLATFHPGRRGLGHGGEVDE